MKGLKSYALKWLTVAIVLLVVSAIALAGSDALAVTAEPSSTSVKEFDIKAYQFTYDPSIITVNKGDRVILHVESLDVAHGVYVDGYEQNVHVHPGEKGTIDFIADKSGKFRFRCSATCGSLHPFMIGELVVAPNAPFGSSIGLAALTALGALGYVWRRKENNHG